MENWVKRVVIIGAGGFGREVAETIRAIELSSRDIKLLGYIDDNKDLHGKEITGGKILGGMGWIDSWKALRNDPLYFTCAIGDPIIKKKVVKKAIEYGYEPITIIHPKAIVGRNCKIGKGVIIQAFAVICVDNTIGDYVHINLQSLVGHDGMIGDYSTVSSLCDVTGFSKLGKYVFMGSGSSVLPSVKVGNYATIGAGGIATKDIEPYSLNVAFPVRN